MYRGQCSDSVRGGRDGAPLSCCAPRVAERAERAGGWCCALLLGALVAAGGLVLGCGEGADGAEGEGRRSSDPTARLLPQLSAEDRHFAFKWAGNAPNTLSRDKKYRISWSRCRKYWNPDAQRQGTGYERACRVEFPVLVSRNLRRIGYEVSPRDAVSWRIFLWRKRATNRLRNLSRAERSAYGDRHIAWRERHGLKHGD